MQITSDLALKVSASDRPAYLRVADTVREAIKDGRLRPGEKIPSTRRLPRQLGLHRHTVMTAMSELVAEGWITNSERSAYRVSTDLPTRYFYATKSSVGMRPVTSVNRKTRQARAVSEPAEFPKLEGMKYRFQSGLPDLRLFPFTQFRTHLAEAFRQSTRTLPGSTDPAGDLSFREALTEYLRRARGITEREVPITHGAQEAFHLVAQLFLGKKDVVAVESLGYPPAWGALRSTGAKLIGIPGDEQGLDPDALDRICRKRRVAFLYVTPLHQYPTTVTLSPARRARLYEVAYRHGVRILEDDYDHEYHYSCQPLAPLVSEDPAGLVLYASSFSKTLFPSARLGFLTLPRELLEPATKIKRTISGAGDGYLQNAVARWMRAGEMDRHLRKMRRAYQERLETLARGLERGRSLGFVDDWRVPDGGMAMWIRTPLVSAEAAKAAARKGVLVYPEELFRLLPSKQPGHHLRLGFANQKPTEINRGLELLWAALGHPRRGA